MLFKLQPGIVTVPGMGSAVFPQFLPAGTINFSALQDAGTIRGREQNVGGVNITWQHMQSRVLAYVRSATTRSPCCCSNECGCLSRDLCCGVSCHPSRVCSALDRPPCHSVSYVTKLLRLEPHPPSVNFISVQALFEGGVNFA